MTSNLDKFDIVTIRKGASLFIEGSPSVKLGQAQQAIVLSRNDNNIRVITAAIGDTNNPIIEALVLVSDTVKLNTTPSGSETYISITRTGIYPDFGLEGPMTCEIRESQIVGVNNSGAFGFMINFYTFKGEFVSGYADSNHFWPINIELFGGK